MITHVAHLKSLLLCHRLASAGPWCNFDNAITYIQNTGADFGSWDREQQKTERNMGNAEPYTIYEGTLPNPETANFWMHLLDTSSSLWYHIAHPRLPLWHFGADGRHCRFRVCRPRSCSAVPHRCWSVCCLRRAGCHGSLATRMPGTHQDPAS